jgi:hypothetical protein
MHLGDHRFVRVQLTELLMMLLDKSFKNTIASKLVIGENTMSMIFSNEQNSCQCSSSSGILFPIIKGKNLPRHHI